MIFESREAAAEILADRLSKMGFSNPLVMAIPRGAVPMARIIAKRLNADLDVVLVHKISPSWHPELAIGAVSEEGEIQVNESARMLGITREEIESAAKEQVARLHEKRRMYTPFREAIDPTGREVIIVDDGIATGATMRAAVSLMRKKNALRIVVAAPVSADDTATHLKEDGVETCLLDVPEDFFAVSQFYEDFPQVEDEEVAEVLHAAASKISDRKRQDQRPEFPTSR